MIDDVDIVLILCLLSVITTLFLFIVCFVYLFRNLYPLKSSSDLRNQFQMYPRVEATPSDGDDLETETTSLGIPITVPKTVSPTSSPEQMTEKTAYPINLKKSTNGFFQLPQDSYHKFSLVDEQLMINVETKKPEFQHLLCKQVSMSKIRPETALPMRKNAWEIIVMESLNLDDPEQPASPKDKLDKMVYGKLPSFKQSKEYLI